MIIRGMRVADRKGYKCAYALRASHAPLGPHFKKVWLWP